MTNKVPKTKIDIRDPLEDDWNAWCEDPVTVYVASKLKLASERMKANWVQMAWDGECDNPVELARMKAYSEAHLNFSRTGLGGYKNV